MASSTRRRSQRSVTPRASPTPQELADAPELALLLVLQHVLEQTTHTLVAMHPDLIGDRSYLRPLDPQDLLADQLVRLAARLVQATSRYSAAAIASLRAADSDTSDTSDIHF